MAAALPLTAPAGLRFAGGKADFGYIREADGPKTIRIYMVNDGDKPEALLKVRPSCGCTAASFGKEEVAPGDSVWIDLTYDPTRRPGAFEKSVRVYPVGAEVTRIPIVGTVVSSPETVAQFFPVDAGLLHLSDSTLMTLSPLADEQRSLYIDVYNSGDAPVYLKLESGYDAVETQPFPSPLPPGEKGLIGVYINPWKEEAQGKITYNLGLHTALSPDSLDSAPSFPITVYTSK